MRCWSMLPDYRGIWPDAVVGIFAAARAEAANIQAVDLGKNAEVWFAEDHTVPIIAFNISHAGRFGL